MIRDTTLAKCPGWTLCTLSILLLYIIGMKCVQRAAWLYPYTVLHTLCARVQTKQIFGLAPWQSVTNLWYSSLRLFFILTSKNLISYFNNTLVCYFKFPQKFPPKTSLHCLASEGQNLIPRLVCILVYHSLECLKGDCSWTVPKNV